MSVNEFRDASYPNRQPKPCIFSREVLAQLSQEQLEKVTDALLDAGVSNPGIATVVGEWIGMPVNEQSVLRHRKKTCGCFRMQGS